MELKKTPLNKIHHEIGGKMVPFAGYEMAIQYKPGIINEHKTVREETGIFDVSHMGQVIMVGQGVDRFLSSLTPTDFVNTEDGVCKYTVLTNDQGGIIDDLIITKLAQDKFYIVINAGCKEKDIEWMKSQLPSAVAFRELENRALIAVQGKGAEAILHELVKDKDSLAKLGFMRGLETRLDSFLIGKEIIITRTGYTGEDGFEVSIDGKDAPALWSKFMEMGAKPAGLGSRDSLRLEMGYPLYGHDIDDKTTPIEAGLGWVISKDHTGFIGAHTILAQKKEGVAKKRIGLVIKDKIVAREGAEIVKDGKKVGVVTSGGFSPSLNVPIAMGYVEADLAKEGTVIQVAVRGKEYAAEVKKFPLVKAGTKSSK